MTSPALAVDGQKLGRLYRQPDSPLPDRVVLDENGQPSLRTRQAIEEVRAGRLVPSITNVIGTLNQPHLLPWTAKMVANEAVRIAKEWPQRLTDAPAAAVTWLKETADRDRDAAADKGSTVHQACEDLARGLPCPPLEPEMVPYVDAWKAWLDRWQPEFLHLEATVFGDANALRYAGTADFIARINGLVTVGDYKTTRAGLHREVSLQLSAVAHARTLTPDNETVIEMPAAEAGVAVHLSPDGYQCAPVVLDDQVWDTFCGLRMAWDFAHLDGELPDGRPALGRPLRGPEALVSVRTGTGDVPVLSASTDTTSASA